ncbi:hypothetical protein HBN50_11760 [Halobacteriovorax sp. GB3]|uniref:hypothetical protein n=1 Tax=Halobacteriovorax sp. GB3 TaxID=2719615 RepID=UPI002362DC88|nr:hypothetical protein [Halobacteriovorax sp. GB3]MDD0853777.1 hypothetical protein [Halobacteriovorax sp. GB3]
MTLLVSGIKTTGPSSHVQGGIYLLGRRIDDFQDIAVGLKLDGTDYILELEKGTWEFAAVGWEGGETGNLTGRARCAYTGFVNLLSDNETVSINLSTSKCAEVISTNERFSNSSDISPAGLGFKTVNFYSCLDLSSPTSLSSSDCAGYAHNGQNLGLTRSYIISYGGNLRTGSSNQSLPGISSRCIDIESNSALRIPTGFNGDAFIEPFLTAFSEPNCQGSGVGYFFKDGLRVNSTTVNKRSYFLASDYINTSDISVFFEHNELTSSIQAPLYGNGILGNLVTSLTLDSSYSLPVSGVLASNSFAYTTSFGSQINNYDEVMIHVSVDDGTCGSGYGSGRYEFARVKSKSASSITFFKSLTSLFGTSSLPSPGTGCRIQVVKVLNYDNITLNDSSSIKPMAFSEADKHGGILALRVRNILSLQEGTTSAHLSANQYGMTSTYSKAQCPANTKCAPLGNGDGTNKGGGFISLFARNLQAQEVSASTSNTAIDAGGLSGTENGHIHYVVRNITTSGTLGLKIHLDAGATNGLIFGRYCQLTEINGGLTVDPGAGSQNIQQVSDICF